MPRANDPVRLAPEKRVQFEALIADLSAHFVNLEATLERSFVQEAASIVHRRIDERAHVSCATTTTDRASGRT